MKRREFITLLGGVAAGPLAARAQPGQMRRIGVLTGTAESDPEGQSEIAAFRKGLQDFGWTDSRNVHIAYRWAAGDADRMRTFARELLALRPDAVLAVTTPAVAALLRETRTIPIVFIRVSDPVASGFVANLANPGGNVTGFTNFEISIAGKWLELLKEIAPRVTRVTVMFNPATAPYGSYFFRLVEAAAPSFAMEVSAGHVHDVAEIERVVAAVARDPNGGLINLPDIFLAVHREVTIGLTARYRVPTIYQYRYFVTSGGLISYGPDVIDQYRRAAWYVDRILKGAKPADLPVQAPVKFELAINLQTAKALGLRVPWFLQQRADEVIE
jgi:putative ABC transport system substrate-binding protein